MPPRTVVIKKYENRRLYDTTNSRYVNLEDVAELLHRGDEVRVVDVATGDDITRLILTQIIVENAKEPKSSFSLDFLRQMVIASGRASQEGAIKYMKAMMDIYQNTYRAMTPPVNPFEYMPGFAPARPQPIPPADPIPAPPASIEAREVDELKRRLAELENLVTGKRAGKAGTKTTAKKARRKK
jgi:polyhydroxyalkanoate synthesis repressor PhaR